MSTILTKKTQTKRMTFKIEMFNSAEEVVEVSRDRELMPKFKDQRERHEKDFMGVDSYGEACDLLKNGYQPTVEKLNTALKNSVKSSQKRIKFENAVAGFAPIVPLALQGVPNNMLDMRMKPIKCKVVDVYYDMTANCGVDKDDLLKAGQKVLSAIIELEKQGYRINLYAVQDYSDSDTSDLMVVKVKSSDKPLDLKRISFPLTHPAFFRCIGFDWYSRFPVGTYRYGFGHSFYYDNSKENANKIAKELFGTNAIIFSASEILKDSIDSIKEVMSNAGKD